jgi:hypothetical protein
MALTLAIYQPLLQAAPQHGPSALAEAGQLDRILFGSFALAILCALGAIVGAALLLGQRTRPVGMRRALLSSVVAVGFVELVGLCLARWLAIVVIAWGRY